MRDTAAGAWLKRWNQWSGAGENRAVLDLQKACQERDSTFVRCLEEEPC